MNPPLIGQTAVVTGSTRGLGREIALALARAGANIVVVGRDQANGKITADTVREAGTESLLISADVTDQQQMEAMAARSVERFGSIDALVCTAGVGAPRRVLWESTVEDYRNCFDVNVLGVMLAMRAALPAMIARRAGRIVVIGGTYGHKGVAQHAIYAASKWALRGLVKSAARESGPYGVNVNLVSPGGIEGERLRRQFRQSAEINGETEQDVRARFVAGTALGRLVTGEDVAAAVIHLVTDAGRMITGQDIIVDSGTII